MDIDRANRPTGVNLRRRQARTEADRELAREANASRWLTAESDNDGRAIDQVKLLQEQAMLTSGGSSSSNAIASKLCLESVCSMCGYLPEWNASRAIAAEEILSKSVVVATRFHSLECAMHYYRMALGEQDAEHLLDATMDRIRRAFAQQQAPADKHGVIPRSSAYSGCSEDAPTLVGEVAQADDDLCVTPME